MIIASHSDWYPSHTHELFDSTSIILFNYSRSACVLTVLTNSGSFTVVCVVGAVVVGSVPDSMIVVAAAESTVLDTMRGVEVVGGVVSGCVVIAAVCVVRTIACVKIHQGIVSCT